MNKEQLDLIQSMLEGFVSDVQYEFDLGTEDQAIKLIENTLERIRNETANTQG